MGRLSSVEHSNDNCTKFTYYNNGSKESVSLPDKSQEKYYFRIC